MPAATIRALVKLTRPYNASAMLLSFGIGMALLDGAGWQDALAGIVIVALLHSAGTIQNDLEDMAVDHANQRGGPLQNGHWPVASARRSVVVLTMLAGVVALLPAHRATHLLFAAAFVAVAWAYNQRPVLASHRPLWSIGLLGMYYGALPLLYGYVLGGGTAGHCFAVLLVAWFMQRASISILKDYKDAPGDKKHKKYTFYLQYGREATARVSVALGLAGYILVTGCLLWWVRPQGLAGIAFVMAGLLALRNMRWRLQLLDTKNESRLAQLFKQSFAGHNQYEALLLACLLLA